jgi:hypothetical protein
MIYRIAIVDGEMQYRFIKNKVQAGLRGKVQLGEEKRTRAKRMRRAVKEKIGGKRACDCIDRATFGPMRSPQEREEEARGRRFRHPAAARVHSRRPRPGLAPGSPRWSSDS